MFTAFFVAFFLIAAVLFIGDNHKTLITILNLLFRPMVTALLFTDKYPLKSTVHTNLLILAFLMHSLLI